jgi:succinyl-CoA synthetase beta subunit
LGTFQATQLAFGLGLEGKQVKNAVKFVKSLFTAFMETDATLAEINPLVVTGAGEVIALDAKMNFDDHADYRHPDFAELRDLDEEDPLEVEASKYHLNYIKLDGNVGCMVNGAGLAMATMDIIKLSGGEPANFLDVGGNANVDTVRDGFKIILGDPNVKAILINIFGGIVRCDRIAKGVIEAANTININVPLVVRLEGTNAEEASKLLNESDIDFIVADSLEDAATKVVATLN